MRTAYSGWYRGLRAPGLVLELPSRGRGRPEPLYAVLTVRGNPETFPAEEAARLFRSTFDRQRGSLTLALRETLLAFNRWLLEQNRHAAMGERWELGLTLLAVREEAVFLIQAGPTWAAHVTREKVQVIAPESTVPSALGTARAIDLHYGMVILRPENRLIVTDAETGPLLDSASLTALTRIQNLHLILEAIEIQMARTVSHPMAFLILAREPTRAVPSPRASSSPEPAPSVPVPPVSLKPSLKPLAKLLSAGRLRLPRLPGMLPQLPRWVWPTVSLPAGPGWVRTLALMLPWAIALITFGAYVYQRNTLIAHRLLAQAQVEAEQATQATAPGAARRHWEAARDLARTAQQYAALPEATALQEQAQRELDRLDQAVQPLHPTRLASLPPGRLRRLILRDNELYVLDREGRCSSEAPRPGGCVLWIGYDEVHRAPLSESTRELLWSGMILQGRPVGPLLDLTWAGTEGGRSAGGLMVLHAQGLAESRNQSPRWVSSRLPPLPDGLLRFYGGNLYVLDREKGQIWRLRPTGEDYAGNPEPYFTSSRMDLGEAMDFLVYQNVYVLYRDGRMRAFVAGNEEEGFPLREQPAPALPSPVRQPIGLTMDPQAPRPWLYIVEPDRLIQAGLRGDFVRQIRGEALRDMVAAAMDEGRRRLFFLRADGTLWVADLPPVE
ncbi:MAG: hypothetical protein RMK32_00880 [Anaerolineae bacterium]|nr:hypothetical protein [Anaerolineae bacterium]